MGYLLLILPSLGFALWIFQLKRDLKKMRAKIVAEGSSLRKEKQDIGRDFVANASHELRTPITIIKGFTETLRDLPEISQEVFHEILGKILKSCERMESLVKNLLLLADLENAPRGHLQECDLLSMVDSVSYTLISLHQEATIETFAHLTEVKIMANPDLLELALRNLLENAVKYAKDAPRIQIRIEEQEGKVVMTITDQGIGIPESDLPHIFGRFYTVNKAHARKLGGAGLGLSIVRKIIENLGGAIKVDSKLGEWTKFTLEFPLLLADS